MGRRVLNILNQDEVDNFAKVERLLPNILSNLPLPIVKIILHMIRVREVEEYVFYLDPGESGPCRGCPECHCEWMCECYCFSRTTIIRNNVVKKRRLN